MTEVMKLLKYGSAILALIYLVYAFLPSQHSTAGEMYPEWLARTTSFVLFLLFGVISYGLQMRRPFYWRLIPALVGTILLCTTIGGLSKPPPNISIPWFLYLLVAIAAVAIFLAFIAWWRNQKDYFAAAPSSD